MKPEINVVVQRERQLLFIALGVVFLFGLALNLATIVRSGALALDRAQQVGLGFLAWAACLGVTWRVARVAVPERDPYLLPTAFLLIGWGLMTLWRLSPYHAQRQTLWLAVSSLLLTLILKAP
ncbi:MAG: hypothetical protein RML93_10085, partial [Anaerolineales bacterium]|nr:hypothetical protein [Anaerolineales bacterium]MDW8447626.1 hypothetical protein [Anaerolineales bacterium]